MLALKMLLRSRRGGQLGLIFSALVLAVAVVTSVALLAERVERALVKESSSFLAADLVVSSSQATDADWLEQAEQLISKLPAQLQPVVYELVCLNKAGETARRQERIA